MMKVERFQINVPDPDISRLKQKLALSVFPDVLDQADWDYGAPLRDVKRLATYWENGFDWRAQEKKLNQLQNYRAQIPVDGFEDLNLHFVHHKSPVKDAIPLLFVHGCKVTDTILQQNVPAH